MTDYLKILGAVSIWAFFNGVLVKKIKTSGVGVGTWTSVIGISIFIGVLWLGSRNFSLNLLNHRQLLMLAGLGMFSALNNACFYTALKISIPQAALFHYLAPLLVIIWTQTVPIFYEPASFSAIAAIFIGLGGMYWLIAPNWKSGNPKLVFLGMLSAIFYSLEIVFSGYLSNDLGTAPEISSAAKLLCQAAIMPMVAFCLNDSLRVAEKKEWIKIVIGGILLYLSFVFYFSGSATVGDLHRGALGYIDRVGAIFLGVIFCKEKITKNAIIGGILILGAGLLILT